MRARQGQPLVFARSALAERRRGPDGPFSDSGLSQRALKAKRQGGLEAELRRLSFIPLIIVDEIGYIPFDPEAANLMFSLVSNRYERASMIVTSKKPFSAWGEIFGDDMAATAMIDRLIHHAEILSLKGDSYRLRGKDLEARPARPADLG
jgi:DNA replication protein DnaC